MPKRARKHAEFLDAIRQAQAEEPPLPDPSGILNLDDEKWLPAYDDLERDEWSRGYSLERERRSRAKKLVRAFGGIEGAISAITSSLPPAKRLTELVDTRDEAIAYVRGNGGPAVFLPAATEAIHGASNAATSTKSPAEEKSELRSWTQADLDKAIYQYKAERASTYADLCDGVKAKKKGAMRNAQERFGRNAIARALGVKSRAMVSKSETWKSMAKELGIPLHRDRVSQGTRHTEKRGKVGHEIAVEDKSAKPAEGADNAPAEQPLETAERQDTIRRINALARAGTSDIERAIHQKAAEELLKKLQKDECTDEQAREVVKMALNPHD